MKLRTVAVALALTLGLTGLAEAKKKPGYRYHAKATKTAHKYNAKRPKTSNKAAKTYAKRRKHAA